MTILLSRLVLCTTLTLLHLWAGLPIRTTTSYQPGDKLREMQGVDFAKPPATLVVFVREDCATCTSSMEFYKRIAGSERRARIVAMSYDAPEALSKYLAAHGFEPDQAVSVPFNSLKIDSSPTLLLVGRDNTISKVWTGTLRERDEEDVQRLVR